MSDKLLKFRWNSETYGVAVQAVGGIIWNAWLGPVASFKSREVYPHQSGQPILVIKPDTANNRWDDKRAVILHSNGIQLALIVDEVTEVVACETEQGNNDSREATFRIWRLSD